MLVMNIVLAVVVVGLSGYIAYGRVVKENFTIESKFIESMPPPRFSNIDMNANIKYPITEEGKCEDCEVSEDTQPIIVDRLIFANRNSQLRAMGDPIRGDLAIVPNPPGWFTPSVTPQIDLQRGALNHLAGDNSPSQQLDNLFRMSSSGLLPRSNIPLANVSGSTYAQFGNRGQDLTITSAL